MPEERYYIVTACWDCPNVRECGQKGTITTCGAMDGKRIRNESKIPAWCPLPKVKKEK